MAIKLPVFVLKTKGKNIELIKLLQFAVKHYICTLLIQYNYKKNGQTTRHR